MCWIISMTPLREVNFCNNKADLLAGHFADLIRGSLGMAIKIPA